jgi:murein DD-endopeptidase MepM/ murein hydrolase activator NlpD
VHPIARRVARLSTALALTLLIACGELPGDTVLLGPKDVGATGGVVYSLDGNAYVVVPPGAISLGHTVRISVEPADALPPDSFGTAVGVAYRFEPSGTRFNSMVTLHTKYDEDDLPPGVAADDLDLVLQSGVTGQWATMAEVVTNPEQQTISGKTSHFSVAAQVFDDSGRALLKGFDWPFAGGPSASSITQVFGQYEEEFADKHHAAMDIVGHGARVRPIGPGTVWKVARYDAPGLADRDRCERMPGSSDEGTSCLMFGNAVMIRHAGNLYSVYGHLYDIFVKLGEDVVLEDELGTEGATKATSRHLHLELRTFDQWSYPGYKEAGELGNGYTVPHPSYGNRGAHYIDPLRYMPELAAKYTRSPAPLIVRTLANGVGAHLRPAPGYAYNRASSYRRGDGQGNDGLKPNELLEVLATAKVATSLDCELWYEVRPHVHDASLTRWVPERGEADRLHFLVTREGARAGSSVPTAWVCAEDSGGDLFATVGGGNIDSDPDGAPRWSVSPSALAFETPVGEGPIAPRTLVVENAGDVAGTVYATIDYGASGGWLSVSPTSRSLNAGVAATITASATGCTGTGTRSATISFSGGGDVAQVPVTLTCREAAGPGVLSVSPTSTWSISGPQGGPFSSTSRIYTLSNTGASPLGWGVAESASWLHTSGATSGTLQPGASTTATFEIGTHAGQLPPGTHNTMLKFFNHTAGVEVTRTARIVVEAIPEPLPVTELVVNGTFTYRTGWSTAGDAWIWNGSSESAYRSAPGYAALGVDANGYHKNGAVGLITQEVDVPAGATRGRFSLHYNMTSSEPVATGDKFTLVIATTPCVGPNQVVSGFALNASNAHTTVGSYVRRTVEFDVTGHAGETLCVVLGGSTNGSYPTILRLDDVSLTVWGE